MKKELSSSNISLYLETRKFLMDLRYRIENNSCMSLTEQLNILCSAYDVPSIYRQAVPKFYLVHNYGSPINRDWQWDGVGEITEGNIIDFINLANDIQKSNYNKYHKYNPVKKPHKFRIRKKIIDVNNATMVAEFSRYLQYMINAISTNPNVGLTSLTDKFNSNILPKASCKIAITTFIYFKNYGNNIMPEWHWKGPSLSSYFEMEDVVTRSFMLHCIERNKVKYINSKKTIIDAESFPNKTMVTINADKKTIDNPLIVTPNLIATHEEFEFTDKKGNTNKYSYLKNIASKRILMNENPLKKLQDVMTRFPNFDTEALSNQDCIEILLQLNEITTENNMLIKLFANLSNILK